MKTILEFDDSKEEFDQNQMMQAIHARDAFDLIWDVQETLRKSLDDCCDDESQYYHKAMKEALEAIYDSRLMEYYN